jgi:hypothetical protein
MKIYAGGCGLILALVTATACPSSLAQENLLGNPGFENLGAGGFFADWGAASAARVGKTLLVDRQHPHAGQACLRLRGTPHTWTTCAAKPVPVRPNTDYWITWWFKARQPGTSRTYLFLQTNAAQRVFPQCDRRGSFDWVLNIVRYRTRGDEKWIAPVLTMQTMDDPPGESWWDDVGVWQELPPHLQAIYRQSHPWDDVTVATARRFAVTDAFTLWGDRPEARIYPATAVPSDVATASTIALVAPGRGHDVYQLAVRPTLPTAPIALVFHVPEGPGPMPLDSLHYRVARSVNVQRVRDKSFPLGLTPDPLVEPNRPEPVEAERNTLFWIEWSPPLGSKPGMYHAAVDVVAGGHTLARVGLELRRWAFDLPAVPHYRSMVLVAPTAIQRFYRGMSELDAYRLAWDLLAANRLSGFNVTAWPGVSLADDKLTFDWKRFDALLAAARQYRATAITIGPMFGGGCSQGWLPHKLLGHVPLADPAFDACYVQLNRQIAARLRAAGMIDKAYVYPYDEPEPDYMDKIARLCDLVHQGAADLKCLMTVDPELAKPLWGKVNAWIMPGAAAGAESVQSRRAAGDEIWIYNMTAAIEEPPLEHRLYLWRAMRVGSQGGLLWNSCWWNKINPWENPTAEAVPVGRKSESLYHYQAGQASLFYPDPAGRGPLVPSLRLSLIRQGVEDFDIIAELSAAWRSAATHLAPQAGRQALVDKARPAILAAVMLDEIATTTSPGRTESMRLLAGNELEVACRRPAVIVYPARLEGRLGVVGQAEIGTRLTLNGRVVTLDADGRLAIPVTEAELTAGLRWSAERQGAGKQWQWPGLR